jgi:hypothetical protein
MFMVWLMDQEDREDAVGDLQQMLFADYNNGCLPQVKSVRDVALHMLDYHPKFYLIFRDLLAAALKAYEDPFEGIN